MAASRIAQSSHLQKYDYSSDTSQLTVEFTNGAIYKYSGVPFQTYYGLTRSSSPGEYFHKNIRNNKKFETEKLAGPQNK